ncbi:MAG TPA: hypothetical protein VLM89_01360, partial [Phycisphaerae bacterium]|nr:hypothetical protein [Phycisphaerae bacterium]
APAGAAKGVATVRAAFLYPPTELLKKEGYYSWPGSGFDAEGHHKQYTAKVAEMSRELGIRVVAEEAPLYEPAAVERFIRQIKEQKPDGLLLVAFKKSEWTNVNRIIDATGVPTIAMATIGVLLMPHIQQMREKAGVYTISSLDNFDAIRDGLNMIRVRRWLRDAVILSIADGQPAELKVPLLGTLIRGLPMKTYADLYGSLAEDEEVRQVARAYMNDPSQRREPSEEDVLVAARAHVALRRLIQREKADAMMMMCLDGIQKRVIPPPCMSFMDLRDEGIVAGCQNDLGATLTMMIGQELFGRAGFQHNPACDTEKNLYYGSHCTSPRKLEGRNGPVSDYILRSHAEAGVGTVPQVLWPEGMEITVGQYVVGDKPEMLVYTGKVVSNYDTPPAGGCRTSLCATLDEIPACDLKLEHVWHPTMWAGNHAGQLKAFCRMFGIAARA